MSKDDCQLNQTKYPKFPKHIPWTDISAMGPLSCVLLPGVPLGLSMGSGCSLRQLDGKCSLLPRGPSGLTSSPPVAAAIADD